MTHDEIKTKWAGLTQAERDAMVAEKVMGWRRMRTFQNPHGTIAWDSAIGTDTGERYTGDVTPWAHTSLWQPTRNISAAMEVVDKFRSWTLGRVSPTTYMADYKDFAASDLPAGANRTASLYRFRISNQPYVFAHNRCEAICLAAVLAVEK